MYNTQFFNNQQTGSISSADVIVPYLMSTFKPTSVVDVGCGIGTWLKVFKQHGITNYQGIDSHTQIKLLKIPYHAYYQRDLNLLKEFDNKQDWDMAISLETAEHLLPEKSTQFVKTLTTLSNIIIFSAAIPQQGGRNHINEKWQSSWAKLFKQEGYVCVDLIRPAFWNNKNIEWWYLQNILIFIKKTTLHEFNVPALKEVDNLASLDIVHPRKYIAMAMFKHITFKQLLIATKMFIKRCLLTKRQKRKQIYVK